MGAGGKGLPWCGPRRRAATSSFLNFFSSSHGNAVTFPPASGLQSPPSELDMGLLSLPATQAWGTASVDVVLTKKVTAKCPEVLVAEL